MITKLLIAAVLLGTPGAGDLRIDWGGASECEGEQGVIERLGVLAPELSIAAPGAPAVVTVHVSVERGPGLHWSVGLELDGPQGPEQRSFVAESCAVAIEATALVLAVAVDPVAVAAYVNREAEPPSPAPVVQAPPKPAARALEPDDPLLSALVVDTSQPADADPRWGGRVGVAILGGGGYGPLQTGSATLMGRLAVIGPRWRGELRGAWLPPVQPALGERGRARVDGFLVGARGCGLLRAGPVEFPLCAGLEAGAVRARALEPIQNRETASQPYVGLMLGPGLSWAPIERLALGLEVEALVPIVSGGFALDGQPALDDAPVGVRALAGLELRLP